MRFYEFMTQTIKPQKPLNPEQARLRNLKYQTKRAKDALKALETIKLAVESEKLDDQN
jgi:hypothetical protein